MQRDKRGLLINSVLPLEMDETITAVLAVADETFELDEGYFVMATSKGRVQAG